MDHTAVVRLGYWPTTRVVWAAGSPARSQGRCALERSHPPTTTPPRMLDGKPQHKAVGDWSRDLREVHKQSGTHRFNQQGEPSDPPQVWWKEALLLDCVMVDFCPAVPHLRRAGPGFCTTGRAVSCTTRARDGSVGWRRSAPSPCIHHRMVADTARGTW